LTHPRGFDKDGNTDHERLRREAHIRLDRLIDEAENCGWYGKLVITLLVKAGKITNVRRMFEEGAQ
jgi:hypothetical protein